MPPCMRAKQGLSGHNSHDEQAGKWEYMLIEGLWKGVHALGEVDNSV